MCLFPRNALPARMHKNKQTRREHRAPRQNLRCSEMRRYLCISGRGGRWVGNNTLRTKVPASPPGREGPFLPPFSTPGPFPADGPHPPLSALPSLALPITQPSSLPFLLPPSLSSQPALGSCPPSQTISRYQQCSSQRIPFSL
ncbi:hypothetical protein LY76DRAFT_35677 [Colletotrichum caudatum]|nr:hypothetical protein LY76DRAFT_35677 [Colletotrichum caudatum]